MLYFMHIGFGGSPNLISQLSGMVILRFCFPIPFPLAVLASKSLIAGLGGVPVALGCGFGAAVLGAAEGIGMTWY